MRCLEEHNVRYALIGGLAVGARSIPRFTLDVDFAVSVETDAEAEGVIRLLLGRGYMPKTTLQHKETGRLATVRLTRRSDPDGVIVDFLFFTAGVETDVVAAATVEQVADDIRVPVAQGEDLIALKLVALATRERPRDAEDILNLLEFVPRERLARTRHLIAKIAEQRNMSEQRMNELLEGLIEQLDRQPE